MYVSVSSGTNLGMTKPMTTHHIPQWSVGDRIAKAMKDANPQCSVQELAEILGVRRNTVSNYINGHTTPKRGVLQLVAVRCNVPLAWLETGNVDLTDPTPPGSPAPRPKRSHPRSPGKTGDRLVYGLRNLRRNTYVGAAAA